MPLSHDYGNTFGMKVDFCFYHIHTITYLIGFQLQSDFEQVIKAIVRKTPSCKDFLSDANTKIESDWPVFAAEIFEIIRNKCKNPDVIRFLTLHKEANRKFGNNHFEKHHLNYIFFQNTCQTRACCYFPSSSTCRKV